MPALASGNWRTLTVLTPLELAAFQAGLASVFSLYSDVGTPHGLFLPAEADTDGLWRLDLDMCQPSADFVAEILQTRTTAGFPFTAWAAEPACLSAAVRQPLAHPRVHACCLRDDMGDVDLLWSSSELHSFM